MTFEEMLLTFFVALLSICFVGYLVLAGTLVAYLWRVVTGPDDEE